MIVRMTLLATALLAANVAAAFAAGDDVIAVPVLRANVTVSDDVVRIGDVIDNAGTAAQVAIYRAPDLGTTGSLPTAQVLSALQAHQEGIVPPGVDNPETYQGARGGDFASSASLDWLRAYSDEMRASSNPTGALRIAAE